MKSFPGLSCLYYISGIFVQVKRNLNSVNKYSCNSTITNFTKIRPVGGTLVHMDGYGETNRPFRECVVGHLHVFYTCGHTDHVTARQTNV